MDCAGECFGSAYEDDCGTCDDDVSNDCELYSISLDGLDLVSFYALPEDNSIENILGGITDYEPGVLGEGMSANYFNCLLYTSPSPRDRTRSRMPSSA